MYEFDVLTPRKNGGYIFCHLFDPSFTLYIFDCRLVSHLPNHDRCQAGDTAEKTGSKGGESIWGAVAFPDEFHPNNIHDRRGVLSMANKGAHTIGINVFLLLSTHAYGQIAIVPLDKTGPNTNRSQFFICYERQPHLNNLHTVFGRLLDGWDVLDKMEALPVLGPAAPKKKLEHRPVDPPVIQKITVHANPLADEMIVFPTPTAPPEKRL